MKRILITGVSRGLGGSLCQALLRTENAVAGCARSDDAIRALRAASDSRHQFAVVDVADAAAVATWAAELLPCFGTPDLLINNAGIINKNAPLWETASDEFYQVMQVNVCGTFHVVRFFLPAMIQRGTGGVLNFSSTWGRTTSPDVAPYCASKFAVEGMTQALAMELPAGMYAVAVNPGVVNTEMLRSCLGSAAGTYPEPQRWAAAAVPFLLGLGPRHNGETVRVPFQD